jgi:integrase
MAITKSKNSPYYYTRFSLHGIRVQESTRAVTKTEAQRYEEKRRSDIREQVIYGNKPKKMWLEAEQRWLQEMQHKRSLWQDVQKFEYLSTYFKNLYLEDITKELVIDVMKTKPHIKPSTYNRFVTLIKSVLNKAHKEWEWLQEVPHIKLQKENNARIRWITRQEADALLCQLPEHLMLMAEFSLATGQRANNVVTLQWSEVDLVRRIWTIPAEKFKNGKIHVVPLNKQAINVLYLCQGKHHSNVFTFKDKPITQCNTLAFRKALKRAGIKNFRWHDLRHTWASWHVQNNTSLQMLQALGGWKDFSMVLRYAHLCPTQLSDVAENLTSVE